MNNLMKAAETFLSLRDRELRFYFVLGFGSNFFSKLEPGIDLSLFVHWISQACSDDTCDVYFDYYGRPMGYVRWQKKMSPNGRGRVVDIVDIFSRSGEGKELLKCIRHHLLGDGVTLRYVRSYAKGEKRKSISEVDGIRSRSNVEAKAGEAPHRIVHAAYIEQAKSEVQRMIAIGEALVAFCASKQYCGRALRDVLSTVSFGLGTGQLQIFRDSQGTPTGALTWMWLSTYTVNRLRQRKGIDLHLSEWNEGDVLCFRDIAPSRKSVSEIAKAISGEMFPDEQACYMLAKSACDEGIDIVEIPVGERPRLGSWLMSRMN
jgi:hemolysin-activating ACP:hemolysin acyltransferase